MKNIVAVVVSLLWLAAIVVWIDPLNDFLECQMSGECHSRGGWPMTDHPMSCYPGQFAAWVPEQRVWSPDKFEMAVARLNGHLYGLEHYEKVANQAINRAMAGQVTNSTGDNNAR